MKRSIWRTFLIIFIVVGTRAFAQEGGDGNGVEIFLIESFVPQESPNQFYLTVYTSVRCRSKVILNNKYAFTISDSLTDNHKAVLDISAVKADSLSIPFVIEVTDSLNVKTVSEKYEIILPSVEKAPQGGGEFASCLYGALIYAIPVVDGYRQDAQNRWGFSKEFPILSFFQGGYNYPSSFVSAEYSHVFKSEENYLRLGWKYLIPTVAGEYFVLGLNGATNFKGYNGISPEATWGVLSLTNEFSLFIRYRYTTNFENPARSYSNISIGLYTWFFSKHM
ncbi:MAG: hypothetical protein LWX56_08205 [Ignavibacteria bacterium]|nr:hypothetical protein [Ignavibacteria bacterium]